MVHYNHHILLLNYVYGIFMNPKIQFLINLVKDKFIYSHHKKVLEKSIFFTFTWTSRLTYSTCDIFYWSKRLRIHCFNKPVKPPSPTTKKTVEKNYESAVESGNSVDILLNMLKRHGIKCIANVNRVGCSGGYEIMAWTIMVLSSRIQKHFILDSNFGKVMFDVETSCVRF
eukprot:508680_1